MPKVNIAQIYMRTYHHLVRKFNSLCYELYDRILSTYFKSTLLHIFLDIFGVLEFTPYRLNYVYIILGFYA